MKSNVIGIIGLISLMIFVILAGVYWSGFEDSLKEKEEQQNNMRQFCKVNDMRFDNRSYCIEYIEDLEHKVRITYIEIEPCDRNTFGYCFKVEKEGERE